MDALTWLQTQFNEGVAFNGRSPIELPNTNRMTLAHWFYVWGFRRGAEVGVERGVYSEALCKANPNLSLYCVDRWMPLRNYRDHVSASKLEGFYQEATQRLAPYRATLIRKLSVEAAKDVPDGSLDFVYIDASHRLEHVIADLGAWSPKVRAGGVVAGHDFIKCRLPSLMHVPQAVYAWADAYEIKSWFVLGRQAKMPGELRDDGRSWFWVQREPRSWKAGPKVHQ